MKTATTDLSKFSRCIIRKKWVANTPEEGVRQRLIQLMIGPLGYPKGLLAVEKKIGERRFDLVCFMKTVEPLLLVECKAAKLDEAALKQVLGYNSVVAAPFICLAGLEEIKTFWLEKGERKSVPFLPPFSDLNEFARRR